MIIRDRVIEIVAREFDIDPLILSENSGLEELGADSPHLLELALGIEESFGIEIPDAILAGLRTVGDLINYIQQNVG